ncbi:hypothetical protein HPP92_007344 [Vanilla planifolia]|uniref:Uncharacterized protein n=1 Tax=Vanilla planifolia TaxID=51239 RepID=A0A835VBS3_VANPL|nr:hypothetical protein HPP92_028105 [Vanilla planifolia]KAG0488737.1 hypothetical protein HPP92_007548 [Vanilla planifolia]KAG0490481.1 hypothetical protein HPP92_007344 [Vanilla planifolia]
MDLNGFSPGPAKLILESKKNIDLLTNSKEDGKVSSPGFADEEEAFLNSICRSLQELIISSQLREIAENLVVESEPNEDCKTPISPPLLLSISDNCPPAPVKPTLTLERDTHGICRKLEF